MKTLLTVSTAAIAALALTVACSSKTKVSDESQVEPIVQSQAEAPVDPASFASSDVTIPTPENRPSIPDETAKVASLGASSSGRSR